MSTNDRGVTVTFGPGTLTPGDVYRYHATQVEIAHPNEGNRLARRKAAAERRHEGGFTAARPYEVHAVAIPNDGTPVALKVGV